MDLHSSPSYSRVMLGGIPTAWITRSQLANVMLEDVLVARKGLITAPKIVVASNGSVIARYHGDPLFRDVINSVDLIDPDGMPLVMVTRLLWNHPLPERIATTDFIHDASRIAAQNHVRFFFLGAAPGIAELAADKLRALHPGLQIAGTRHGYFDAGQEAAICEEILEAGTDILWVGLGSPLQEAFAIRNRAALRGVAWIRTCGGLFDHYSGEVPRAPIWMQKCGLEWLHRSMLEPRRLGIRYLRTNPVAIWHLLTKSSEVPLP